MRPCVKDIANAAQRLVLLNPAKVAPDAAALPGDLQAEAAVAGSALCQYELETGFEHLTAKEVLRQVIPASVT